MLSSQIEGTRFFLTGVHSTADEAVGTARAIVALREEHHALVAAEVGIRGVPAVDFLFERPLINVNLLANHLDVTFATANKVVEGMAQLGLLEEITGGRRNRIFRHTPYLKLFEDPVEAG